MKHTSHKSFIPHLNISYTVGVTYNYTNMCPKISTSDKKVLTDAKNTFMNETVMMPTASLCDLELNSHSNKLLPVSPNCRGGVLARLLTVTNISE